MKITITPIDLEKGKRNDPYGCAVNLACRRAFDTHAICASYTVVKVGDKDFLPSREMAQFMRAFDEGWKLEPMELELEEVWAQSGVIILSS